MLVHADRMGNAPAKRARGKKFASPGSAVAYATFTWRSPGMLREEMKRGCPESLLRVGYQCETQAMQKG